jgi:hypothetical protein
MEFIDNFPIKVWFENWCLIIILVSKNEFSCLYINFYELNHHAQFYEMDNFHDSFSIMIFK